MAGGVVEGTAAQGVLALARRNSATWALREAIRTNENTGASVRPQHKEQ